MKAGDLVIVRRLTWGLLTLVIAGVLALGAWFVIAGGSNARREPSFANAGPPVLFRAPDFTLVERSGRNVSTSDLRGHVWIADFVFTSCAGPCPLMTHHMSDLQAAFADEPGLRFVSFTVDPVHDTPRVLSGYADAYKADPRRWLFLTGDDEREIRRLIVKGFFITAEPAAPPDDENHHAILHSTYFLLVDAAGRVRGTYESTDGERLAQLVTDTRRLFASERPLLDYRRLPTVNAALNAAALVLLLSGFAAIRSGRVRLHMRFMLTAFGTSVLFLASYLTYHTLRQAREGAAHTQFKGVGWIATAYHVMLASHVVLAAVVPVLAIILLRRAFRGDFVRHRRMARWAFPVWLYVSVTGVLIYVMLYHWPC